MRAMPTLLLGAAGLGLIFASSDAPAGCTTGGLSFYPSVKVALPANGRIVVDGYGDMVGAVGALGDGALSLASDGDEIPLRVVDRATGSFRVGQVILAPARALPAGARVTLRAAKGSAIEAWLAGRGPVGWATAGALGDAGVRWVGTPAARPAKTGRSCPPYAYVPVRVPVDHPERLLGVVAEVRSVKRGSAPRRFLMPAGDGEITLGWLGCSAEIELDKGMPHWVTLTAVDLAGHEVPAPARIAITAPN